MERELNNGSQPGGVNGNGLVGDPAGAYAGAGPNERPAERPGERRNAGHRHWQHGMALTRRARWRDAAAAFGRATRAAPQDHLYWINLAHAQRRSGVLLRAAAAARRALLLQPGDAIALQLLGDCLLQLHRYADAGEAFRQLEAGGHEDPEAMLQHASVLQAQLRHREAAEVLLRALSIKPNLVRGHALLADACRDQGLKREAVECMKTVLALEPGNLEAMSHLSYEKRHVCDWSDFDADLQRLRDALAPSAGLADAPLDEAAAPAAARPRIAAAFGLLSLPLPPALQLAAARGESLALAAGAVPLPPVLPRQRAGRKPRLGWLSYDFREHPVAQLLVDVLEQIDRSRFDVVLYSCGPDDRSALRARLIATADGFVDLHGMSDPLAAERIRADGIDLLIDLMGHTRGHRMPIFARRPAPLQVGFLGYPGSSGADYIDYLIGDPHVTPLELHADYSEKLAQLPLTFQPNGRQRPVPGRDTRALCRSEVGLPDSAFVLCAFNHTYKILPEAFDAWCSVLHAVPHAVLWLKEPNAQLHANVRREAALRGVDAARIVFAPVVSYADHFARLALADVFIDTWPYNAHTTAADALWAGVPVVTLHGNGFASRVAASVLNAAGIGELAFETVEDYCRAIVALATDAELLAGYRAHLVEQRLALPLFDTARYTVELEDLLQRMVQRWRAGLPAAHLPAQHAAVEPLSDVVANGESSAFGAWQPGRPTAPAASRAPAGRAAANAGGAGTGVFTPVSANTASAVETDAWLLRTRNDQLIYVPGRTSSLTTYVMLEQEQWFETEIGFVARLIEPGTDVLDIGANHGVYTLALAQGLAGAAHVFAFEPTVEPRARLVRTVQANALESRVTVVPCALSDRAGSARFHTSAQSELNSLHSAGGAGHEDVVLQTLDAYAAGSMAGRTAGFVKIDAEGEELRVLSGGHAWFSSSPAVVMFELMHGARPQPELVAAFQALGYGVFRHLPGLDLLLEFDAADTAQHAWVLNLFAVKPAQQQRLAVQGLLVRGSDLLAAAPAGAAAAASAVDLQPLQRLAGCAPMHGLALLSDTGDATASDAYALALTQAATAQLGLAAGPAARVQLLMAARDGVQQALNSGAAGDIASWTLLVHCLYALGDRGAALAMAAELLKHWPAGAVQTTVFMPVLAADLQRPRSSDAASWMRQTLAEFIELRRSHSSFFAPAAAGSFEPLLQHPDHSVEMERRYFLGELRQQRLPQTRLLQRLPEPGASANAPIWAAWLQQLAGEVHG